MLKHYDEFHFIIILPKFTLILIKANVTTKVVNYSQLYIVYNLLHFG